VCIKDKSDLLNRNTFQFIILTSHVYLVLANMKKKLSYCWETVQRESMPRIAELDVEMTT